MVYRKLFINIVVRIAIILCNGFVLVILIPNLNSEYYFIFINLIIVLVIQIVLLARYLNKLNNDLVTFLQNIRNNDTATHFPNLPKKHILRNLYHEFNEINAIISYARLDSSKKTDYLDNVIDHVDVGVLIYNSNDGIELANHTIESLLNVKQIKNLDNISNIDKKLANKIKDVQPGEISLHKMILANGSFSEELITLSIRKRIIKQGNELLHIIALQNITNELDEQELVSWNKLIRILTHEIMNSLSPVISLASTLKNNIPIKGKLSESEINSLFYNTKDGLETIEETSNRLMNFLLKYRSLTSIPKPNIKEFKVFKLFKHITDLFNDHFIQNKIKVNIDCPESILIMGDIELLEQVFTNLLKNATEALAAVTQKSIDIYVNREESGKVKILFRDSGPGIPSEIEDKIFIPFFTTKDDGSGIGLSLAKQILHLHKGNIQVHPYKGKTAFLIVL